MFSCFNVFMKKYRLELIVFLTGACVMILELVGSRVLAPYLGTSIVVWTSLIGLILASLSLGYWWGGKLADKQPNWGTFAAIIFMAGLYVGLVGIMKTVVLELIQSTTRDLRLSSIIATLILFCPPSILLGMVSPYAVKLKLQNLATSGTTVGELYAISTIGSIVGTFLTGFVLIAFIGHTKIIFLIAIILLLTSLLATPKDIPWGKGAAVLIFALLGSQAAWLETVASNDSATRIDTQYNHIRVFDTRDRETGRPIRLLQTDPFVVQSGSFLDDREASTSSEANLVFHYTKFLRLVNHFFPAPKRALMIGGAAYIQPRDFLEQNPEAVIDVVEIDPAMTAVAQTYFGLKPDPRLTPYHEDARPFLNRTAGGYDAIFVDAYHAIYAIPYQLTTQEAVRAIYEALTPNGVVMANIIAALEGNKAIFLEREYATYSAVFPQVYAFHLNEGRPPDELQNVIIVALKAKPEPSFTSSNPVWQQYLDQRWTKSLPSDGPILTDDFAPVEQYALRFLAP